MWRSGVHADMQRLAQACAAVVPNPVREVSLQSEAPGWRAAEQAEIDSCLEHKTWHSSELPRGSRLCLVISDITRSVMDASKQTCCGWPQAAARRGFRGHICSCLFISQGAHDASNSCA
jgi:hypothetical protein